RFSRDWSSDVCSSDLEIALSNAPHGRGTVGWIDNFPNSRNVIPGRVKITVDLRAADDATLDAMDAALRELCERVQNDTGVDVVLEPVVYFPPQAFDRQLVDYVDSCARAMGI